MKILIADSGSTKTEWLMAEDSAGNGRWQCGRFLTSGLNPCLMPDDAIRHILQEEVVAHVGTGQFDKLHFYGAGCTPAQEPRMQRILQDELPVCTALVASDLRGAARVCCGSDMGIVAILGTGSGSGLYDGTEFVMQTPSLGYILGDEGSGAVLGRNFLSDLYKGQFPEHVARQARELMNLELSEVIESVYRRPSANRYLAGFARYIKMLEHETCIQDFLVRNFKAFFLRNIVPYGHPELPVHFVGSIAYHFAVPLREAAAACGCAVGVVVQSPISRVEESLLRGQDAILR